MAFKVQRGTNISQWLSQSQARDFRSVMAEHGIGWANWDYKGDFALIDGEGQPTSAWVGLLG